MECAASAKRLSTVFSSCLGCFHILTQLYLIYHSVAKELASVLRKGAKRLRELKIVKNKPFICKWVEGVNL